MRKLRLLALPLIAGCAIGLHAQAPASDTTSTAKATVYFFRLREGYGALLKPSVFCDGSEVGRMRNGRYLVATFAPGHHTITSTFPGSGAAVDLKAGETYYVQVSMSRASFMHAARGEVSMVEPGQGKFETAQLRPGEPEDMNGGNAPAPAEAKSEAK